MVAAFPQQLVKVAVAVDKQRHHAREDPKMAHLGPKLEDRPLYGLAKVQGSIGALTICLPSACLLLAFSLPSSFAVARASQTLERTDAVTAAVFKFVFGLPVARTSV